MGDMHPEARLGSGADDDRRCQGARPVLAIVFQKRCGTVRFAAGADSERGQSRDHRLVVDGHRVADPVVERGGHSEAMGERGQGRIGHSRHLAPSPVISGVDRRGKRRSVQPAESDNSMVSTPPMINAIPATIIGVSGSANSTRAITATRATPHADQTP